MANYLTRADLIQQLGKIRRAVRQGRNRAEIIHYISRVEEAAQVGWAESEGSKERQDMLARIEAIVRGHPGITFRELATECDRSLNYIKKVVYENDQKFRFEELTNKRGAYGRKPYGLWLL